MSEEPTKPPEGPAEFDFAKTMAALIESLASNPGARLIGTMPAPFPTAEDLQATSRRILKIEAEVEALAQFLVRLFKMIQSAQAQSERLIQITDAILQREEEWKCRTTEPTH